MALMTIVRIVRRPRGNISNAETIIIGVDTLSVMLSVASQLSRLWSILRFFCHCGLLPWMKKN